MSGRYTPEDAQDLDLHVVRHYCMAMSFRSLADLKAYGRDRQLGVMSSSRTPAEERLDAALWQRAQLGCCIAWSMKPETL